MYETVFNSVCINLSMLKCCCASCWCLKMLMLNWQKTVVILTEDRLEIPWQVHNCSCVQLETLQLKARVQTGSMNSMI